MQEHNKNYYHRKHIQIAELQYKQYELKSKLVKLNKYKNKQILLLGDLNIDLIRYDTDTFAQTLIEYLSCYGLLPVISRPTRITDHSASLIDHIYVDSLFSIAITGIVTLDISDHLGIYDTSILETPKQNNMYSFCR